MRLFLITLLVDLTLLFSCLICLYYTCMNTPLNFSGLFFFCFFFFSVFLISREDFPSSLVILEVCMLMFHSSRGGPRGLNCNLVVLYYDKMYPYEL